MWRNARPPATWLPQEIPILSPLESGVYYQPSPLVLTPSVVMARKPSTLTTITASQNSMRMNENTIICGDKVILVPYRPEHVDRYHEWMKSPELLESTASEPLTIEEERDMQKKWQEDDDKLTFILLARSPSLEQESRRIVTPEAITSCPMIGDVNLFLPDGPTGDVECEIMLAEPSFRGKGFAQEALSLFLTYVVNSPLNVRPSQFIARIGADNASSLRLFDRLGFGQVKLVEVWNEVELRWGWNDNPSAKPEQWSPRLLEGRVGVYA